MDTKEKIQRRITRLQKVAKQFQSKHDQDTTALFIFGCQRSGTNMLIDVFEKSLDIKTFGEGNREAFYDGIRLRDKSVRDRLIDGAHCKWAAFKPLCDLQYADEILDSHPGSKAIWIFRHYQDVANSALAKWGDEQYRHIQRIANSDACDNWVCERCTPEMATIAQEALDRGISHHSAGVLKWYMRNLWYFELDLSARGSQVLVVNYEQLVSDPELNFRRIFEYLDIQFDQAFIADIFSSSVNKREFPEIDSEIKKMSDDLFDRLQQEIKDGRG